MEYELSKKVLRTVELIKGFGAMVSRLGKRVSSNEGATEELRVRLDNTEADASDTRADVAALESSLKTTSTELSSLVEVVESYGDAVLIGFPAMYERFGKVPLVRLNGIVGTVSDLQGLDTIHGTTNYYFVREEKAVYWVDAGAAYGPFHSINTMGMAAIMITDAIFICENKLYAFDGENIQRFVMAPEFASVLSTIAPRITARSGFIKLSLDHINADGTTDAETAYVNLPAATDSLAGLMTNVQNKVVNSLPANIIGNITPYHGASAVDINGWGATKNTDGYSQSKQIVTARIKGATSAAAGVMTPAQVNKLGLLDKVLLELTGIGDERSLEIYANWDPEITSMHNMFQNDKTLVYFPKVDTSKVTNFQNAFDGASNLTTFPAELDTRSATNINFMFCNSAVKELPWMDTSNVTEAYIVFENCKNITSVPQYDFSKVKSTGWGLFMGCEKLKKVPQLDFSSCSRLENLFLGCPSLEEVEPFVAPKVPWNGIRLFCECVKLSTVPNIDLSLCTQLDNAFQGLPLISNLGNLSTGNCKNFVGAFRFNPNLEKIEGVDVAKATVLRETFQEDSVLTYLKLLNFGTQKSIDMSETFSGVTAWGAGSDENRQSLVDSLLTYSFDRAAAGYAPLAFQLEPEVLARLTDEEIAAITAKGFTLTSTKGTN